MREEKKREVSDSAEKNGLGKLPKKKKKKTRNEKDSWTH
jgi:hypothetical protein